MKRSVEGDLGMRHNAATIVEVVGLDAVASDSGLPASRVTTLIHRFAGDVEHLPDNDEERKLDRALARAAVKMAVHRHCGSTEMVYTVSGPAIVQHGKDLSRLKTVIGTGGPLVHGEDPHAVLCMAMADASEPQSLRPRAPRLLIDRHYLLYACGLLGAVEPEAALELTLKNLAPADTVKCTNMC